MSKTLPALTAAADADGTEEFLVNQLGSPRRMTGIQIRSYLSGTLFPTAELLETFEIPADTDTLFVSGVVYVRTDGDPNIERGIRSLDRFLPDGSTDNTNGGWWRPFFTAALNIFEFIPRTEWTDILNRDSTYGIDEAFWKAYNELPTSSRDGGGCIQFPTGGYEAEDTWNLEKPLRLMAFGGTGAAGFTCPPAARIRWPVDKDGIIVNAGNTYGRTTKTNDTHKTAGGSVIQGLHILGRGRTGGTLAGTIGNGIVMRARANVRECWIFEWRENGVQCKADTGGTGDGLGNANGWRLTDCYVSGNGKNGLFCDGGDANAGVASYNRFENNLEWGRFDSSFLGNTYLGNQYEDNTLGGGKSDSNNAHHSWFGEYEEGGQAFDDNYGIVVGGKVGDTNTHTGNAFRIASGSTGGLLTKFAILGTNADTFYEGERIAFIADDDTTTGVEWEWDDTKGVWRYQHGATVSFGLTTDAVTLTFGRQNNPGQGLPYVPRGLFVGDSDANARFVTTAISIPTTGDHALGERRWRRTAVAGQNSEWICTTGGYTTTSWSAGNFYVGQSERTNSGQTYRLEYRLEDQTIPVGAASTQVGTGNVTFDLVGHGLTVGAWVHFQNTDSIGNVRLDSQMQVTSVPDVDSFVVESTDDATSSEVSNDAYTVDFGPNGVSANAPVHTSGSVTGADGHNWTWISAASVWSRAADSYIEASVTGVNPPSLAGGTVSGVTTFTLTGVALGDFIDQVSFSLNLQGVRLDAWVSATNQGSYQFVNPTGNATVDLGSGTIRVRACKTS